MDGVAAVKQPNQSTKAYKEDRPSMNRCEGEHRDCAEERRKKGAADALQARDQGRNA
jgi:hypothetical protein